MSITHLYIEPTSHCNLNCEMCARNHWQDETVGHMDFSVFKRLIDEIPSSAERIFFGGFGEPLTHPDILGMVRRAKRTGRRVEMITNGLLLSEEISKGLVLAGIDKLWVSLDSLDAVNYSSIRRGGTVDRVLDNIRNYNLIRGKFDSVSDNYTAKSLAKSKLGVAFVLMKKNLGDFHRLLKLASRYGIDEIKATHLIPYDAESERQVCHGRLANAGMFREQTPLHPHIDLPLMEPEDLKSTNLITAFGDPNLSFSVLGQPLNRRRRYCRFVSEGYTFVRWDGAVSPCMALLHSNRVYQSGRLRHIRHCDFGDVRERSLSDIYSDASYSEFRGRVEAFSFSPCAGCASCELFASNETDCTGNPFPTCGGCLWAEGLFQCP